MSRLAVVLALVFFSAPLFAEDFKPTVPLLELRQHEGEWQWMRGDKVVPPINSSLVALFYEFSIYKNEATGWTGLKDGKTTNLLVVHVAQDAPEDKVTALMRRARKSNLPRIAIALTPVSEPLDATRAPDADELPGEYLLIDLDKDKSKNPLRVYLEECTTGLMFSVAREGLPKLVADGSEAATKDLVITSSDNPVDSVHKEGNRESVINALTKALIRKLEQDDGVYALHVFGHASEESAPWIWFDLAARACADVNKVRQAAGRSALPIQWPHTYSYDLAENPNDPIDPRRPGRRAATGPYHGRKDFEPGERPHEERLLAALNWLRDHQNREGYWSATGFSDDSVRVGARRTFNIDHLRVDDNEGDKGWEATCDIGLTGLALLAYAGAGYDHKYGDYRATCRQGVLYLRKVQDNDGCFGAKEDDHFVYNHAICAMAIAEMFGLSNDLVLRPVMDKAVEFILRAQNPGLGWRYGVQAGINDSSVTSWMIMALRSARLAGCEFDSAKSYSDAAEWYKLVTVDVNGYPKTGYDTPGGNNARLRHSQEFEHNPAMDAIYATCMLAMGKADAQDKTVKALTRACVEKSSLPVWEKHKVDFYYWYYASLACYQAGETTWKTWDEAMSKTLLDHQRGWHSKDTEAKRTTKETLDEHGSWDPIGAWGTAGSRVYSTAMGALILETPYRYKRAE